MQKTRLDLSSINEQEDQLIGQFRSHPVLSNIAKLAHEDFRNLLIQRRYLSMVFTPVYDLIIDGLVNTVIREEAKKLLREEYEKPYSHREKLFVDLTKVGIARETLLRATPTATTQQTIIKSLGLTVMDVEEPLFQLKLITIMRFWGEILVSNEYQIFWPSLERLGLSKRDEEGMFSFYWDHYQHDKKVKQLSGALYNKIARGANHSLPLSIFLVNYLVDYPDYAEYFLSLENEIVMIKSGFYDQFTHMLP